MADLDDIIEDLKQKRDELRVQIHLASKEVKDEWEELEEKMNDFSAAGCLCQVDRVNTGIGSVKAIKQFLRRLSHLSSSTSK